MRLTFAPMRSDTVLTLHRAGDILSMNDTAFDFSEVSEDTPLLREDIDCDWLASDVTRVDGELQLTLVLPHGGNAPPETLFPTPLDLFEDGIIPLPPHDREPDGFSDADIAAASAIR